MNANWIINLIFEEQHERKILHLAQLIKLEEQEVASTHLLYIYFKWFAVLYCIRISKHWF